MQYLCYSHSVFWNKQSELSVFRVLSMAWYHLYLLILLEILRAAVWINRVYLFVSVKTAILYWQLENHEYITLFYIVCANTYHILLYKYTFGLSIAPVDYLMLLYNFAWIENKYPFCRAYPHVLSTKNYLTYFYSTLYQPNFMFTGNNRKVK